MEGELGDTFITCGDVNAQSSLWDQPVTNQRGCALKAELCDFLFIHVSTASPTHPCTRPGDTDRTTDLALVSPKLAQWTYAKIIVSRSSDHLPVVYRNQGLVQDRNSNIYRFKYGKSDTGVTSKLQARKPAYTTNPRQKTAIQPHWWNKETQGSVD